MLYQQYMTPCVRLIPKTVPDGEGGYLTQWTEGEVFDAAIVLQDSSEGRRAETEHLKRFFTVFTDKKLRLTHQDVFRRISDQQVFRVTSEGCDRQTPACASFSLAQVTAEGWELT